MPLTKADNRRVQGWYDMAEWLRVRPSSREQWNKDWSGGAGAQIRREGGTAGTIQSAGTYSASRRLRGVTEPVRSGSTEQWEGECSPEGVAGEARYAALRIFRGCCPNLVRCLPQVQIDEKNPNDVANEPHELTHSVDAIRYFCAGRPLPAEEPRTEEKEWEEGELSEFLEFGR